MGKARRVRAARAEKHHRRAQADRAPAPPIGFPGGWQVINDGDDGDDSDDFADSAFPDDALLDTSRCPVMVACVGCGARDGLAATTAAFSRPGGGFDVACATVCRACDGRSFLHMLDQHALDAACTRHTEHAAS